MTKMTQESAWCLKDEDPDHLIHGSPEEAAKEFVFDRDLTGRLREHAPDSLVVEEYARNQPTDEDVADMADDVATRFLESLSESEEFGNDPDDGCPAPTAKQRALARAFVEAVLADWCVHWMHRTGRTVTVDIKEMVREALDLAGEGSP